MGKGQGKGEGKGRGFNEFLTESYFAFWFRQWAAFFIILGIIFIIVGGVVFAIYPGSQDKAFSTSQLVTSSSSDQYGFWSQKIELLSYEILDHDPKTGACSSFGPYLYNSAVIKAQVVFSGNSPTVQYSLSESNSLLSSSASPVPIRSPNPPYIDLVKSAGGEDQLFIDAFTATSLGPDLHTLYTNTAPILIGARGVGQMMEDSVQTLRNGVFGNVFSNSGLKFAVDNFPLLYLSEKVAKFPCPFCSNPTTGIQSSLQSSYFNCTGVPSIDNFKAALVSNYSSLTADTPCNNFLKAHAFDTTLFNAQGPLAYKILESLQTDFSLWYSPSDTLHIGYCQQRASAPSAFQTEYSMVISTTQIDFVCDTFIEGFFSLYPIDRQNLGKRYLCSGSTDSSGPSLSLVSSPSGFTFSSLEFASSIRLSPYDDSKCTTFLTALIDTSNFVIPAYENETIPTAYQSTLSQSEFTTLLSYIHQFDNDVELWITSYWVGTTSLTCTGCVLQPLSAHSDESYFSSSLLSSRLLLFPESGNLAARAALTALSITNPDPKPTMTDSTLFTNVTAGNGVLWYIYGAYPSSFGSLYSFNTTHFSQLKAYSTGIVDSYLTKLALSSSVSKANLGFLQFAQAHLACGPKNPTAKCGIAEEFFSQSLAYQAEIGIAQNVVDNSAAYYNSFTTADAGTTITYFEASDILGYLLTKSVSNLMATSLSKKYFYFLLATFVRDSSFSSSGALPSLLPSQWINSYTDQSVKAANASSYTYGFEYSPNSPVLTVNTGRDSSADAFKIVSIDGSDRVTAYPTAQTVSGMFTFEGLPPAQFSSSSEVTFFDTKLERSFKYQFGGSDTIAGIDTVRATENPTQWNQDSNFGITTDGFLPLPGSNGRLFYSPCSVSLPSGCSFAESNGDFSLTNTIDVVLGTGLIVQKTSCHILSISAQDVSLPLTAPSLNQTTFIPQARRMTVRLIPDTQSSAYVEHFTKVNDTAKAILIALVVVGGLFLMVGVAFLVFYMMRQQHKGKAKSEMDLVEDPFGEKKKDVARMKY